MNGLVNITYRDFDDQECQVQILAMELITRAAKLPGAFLQSTQGNLEYHTKVLEEVQRAVNEQRPYTVNHDWEQTVQLLLDLKAQVDLCEYILKYNHEDMPLDSIVTMRTTKVEFWNPEA